MFDSRKTNDLFLSFFTQIGNRVDGSRKTYGSDNHKDDSSERINREEGKERQCTYRRNLKSCKEGSDAGDTGSDERKCFNHKTFLCDDHTDHRSKEDGDEKEDGHRTNL